MNNLSKEIKHVFASELMKWNPLYEAKFNDKIISTPLYVGVYRNVKKPGYLNAERNFIKRLETKRIVFRKGLCKIMRLNLSLTISNQNHRRYINLFYHTMLMLLTFQLVHLGKFLPVLI